MPVISRADSKLPVNKIEDIIQAEGEVANGVLDVQIKRQDIGNVLGPLGVTFTPAFEIHGDLYFQPLSGGNALMNGNMALLESEVNPFIAVLLQQGLVFQAFHRHFPMNPQIWFVHYRGLGDPVKLARQIKAALNVTATPFPQMRQDNPTTPMDPEKLAKILHGTASVGDEGVVTVTVDRTDTVTIDGVKVNPDAGISTRIEFRPIGGDQANVVPDFSMTSSEVNPVVKLMLNKLGWYQGCLYNKETAEKPQLYFDHMLKSGDAYDLAREIRKGLDLTNSKLRPGLLPTRRRRGCWIPAPPPSNGILTLNGPVASKRYRV